MGISCCTNRKIFRRIVESTDVLNIMLSYMEPNELISFFLHNNVDVRTKFKYNAISKLCKKNIKVLLQMFPNMTLVGTQYGGFMDSYVVSKCVKIRTLVVENELLNNLDKIIKYKNLRSIEFSGCTWNTRIYNLIFLSELRILKFDCGLNVNDLSCLSECSKLKVLEMGNTWNRNASINLPHLKYLKINNSPNYANHQIIRLSIFNECPKLKTLVICCDNTIHITPTKYNLKKLVLAECRVKNIKDISEINNLHHLDISNCIHNELFSNIKHSIAKLKKLKVMKY